MYNRYTPKQDGGFNKNRVPDAPPPPQSASQSAPQGQPSPISQIPPGQYAPSSPVQEHSHPTDSASGFLSKLLPKNMDTGDLLMLLILLLLLSDGSEDAPNPLLTIALFFLME